MNSTPTALLTDLTAILTAPPVRVAPLYRASHVPVGGAGSFSLASSVQVWCSAPRFVALYGRVRRCVSCVHLARFLNRSPEPEYVPGLLQCESLMRVPLVCVPLARFAAHSEGLLFGARSAIPVRH